MEDKSLNNHASTGDPLGLWEHRPSEWQEYKLWDLAEYINGKAFKPTDFSLEGLPIIKITELKYGLSPTTSLYSGDYEEKYILSTGDLLFAWSGNPETSLDAFWWRGEKALLNQHIFRVIPRHNINKTYLFFLLKYLRPTFIRTARDKATSMGHVKVSDLQRLIAVVPPFPEQKAIASILGALDDKIELNRKMNETLEAMARAIFKSWFVDFDPIPGLAPHKEWHDSPLGKIPKGWKIKTLNQIADFLNGLALQKYPPMGNEYLPVIKIAELRRGITESSDKASTSIDNKYIVEDGDILFSWSGSLEVCIWCGGKGALNQHLFKVTSEIYPKWFYYQWTKEYLPKFQMIAAGKATTMGHIQRHHLSSTYVAVPKDDDFGLMNKEMEPLMQQLINNNIQSRTLATTRDALLPKLLSGELRVKDAERFVERN